MPTSKQTIDWYDDNADVYAASLKNASASPYHAYYEKPAIYSLLPNLKGKKVLSLGCGSGEDVNYLKKRGAIRSMGVDISENLIRIAKKQYPESEFIRGDMEKLDLKDEEFNLVFSSFALHYLPTYKKVFKESYRVLKSKGILLFSAGHPIGSSMEKMPNAADGVEDRRLGIVINRNNKTRKTYGNYLSREPFRTRIPEFDVTYWKQPLSTTINELLEAGFVIKKCLEPKPKRRFESLNHYEYQQLLRIPDIIIFKAQKP